MAKVESYEIKGKDGRVIRVVNYYSIHEVRKLYNQYLSDLEKEKGVKIFDSFETSVIEHNGFLFLKGELKIWNGEAVLKNIVLILPVTNEASDSIEFAKIITRIEKKTKTIVLALEDPDEARSEIEDIENISEKEEKITQKEDLITPSQLNLIVNFVKNAPQYMQSLGEFINKNFNKTNIRDLTKSEASQVISVWMNEMRKRKEG